MINFDIEGKKYRCDNWTEVNECIQKIEKKKNFENKLSRNPKNKVFTVTHIYYRKGNKSSYATRQEIEKMALDETNDSRE